LAKNHRKFSVNLIVGSTAPLRLPRRRDTSGTRARIGRPRTSVSKSFTRSDRSSASRRVAAPRAASSARTAPTISSTCVRGELGVEISGAVSATSIRAKPIVGAVRCSNTWV
jgi:hypothetical protein